MEKKASINVVAAVICENKKFLIAQRGRRKDYGLLWEFPGGKVEQGETLEEALLREIKEEIESLLKQLNIKITSNTSVFIDILT